MYRKEIETEPVIDNRKKITASNFNFQLANSVCRTYGIQITFKNNRDNANEQTISYEIRIEISPNDEGYDLYIDKSDLYINYLEPELVIEELSCKIMKVMYPIKTKVNRLFQQECIINHQEIIKKWDDTQDILSTKYESIVFDKIVAKVDHVIQDVDLFENSLNKDMFWSSFFHPVLGQYNSELKREQSMVFPIGANRISFMEGIQTVYPFETDYATIKIFFDGKNDQNESIKACYDLECDSKLIKYITVDYENNISGETITFSAYEIPNRPKHIDSEMIVEVNQNQPKKKRSFWSFLDY